MKYCSHCGKEIADEAVICPGCGCEVSSKQTSSAQDHSALFTVIKVFMVIACIAMGWTLIPLAWLIPMTVSVFRRLAARQPIGVGFKVCVLLFCSLIAGIMLLCVDTETYSK